MIAFIRKYILAGSVRNEYAPNIFLILCFFATASSVYYMLFFMDQLFIRLILSSLKLVALVLIERSSLCDGIRAFLLPFILIFLLMIGAVLFDGDYLIFTYSIGGALISLTYMRPKGVAAYIAVLSAVQAVFLIALGRNLMGVNFTMVQNYLGLLTAAAINLVIYVFCRNYNHTLFALTDAKDKANQAAVIKGAFLSNMSHEIRTPMNAIVGMTAIGKASRDLESAHYTLNKIEDASTHLLGIINDVLDASKLESGKFELSLAEFNFERMIQRVTSVISFSANEKKQTLSVSVDPGIPPVFIGDDLRITQIIMNLLSNAVKFTADEGFVTLSAALLAEEEDGLCTIEIKVADSGIGISPEQQANLFQAFYQAEANTVRKFGGTGLGLSISKNIADMMGGKIFVESELGKGATFIFTVKLQRGSLTEPARTEAAAEDNLPVFENKHVLIAEDIEINREIVMALLEPTGLNFCCAENGAEAVRLFSACPQKYDLIFMDLQMPEVDGLEATRLIRALDEPGAKTIPIIAMTANVLREDVEQCLEAGMNGHVGKPLDMDEVIDVIKEYLL